MTAGLPGRLYGFPPAFLQCPSSAVCHRLAKASSTVGPDRADCGDAAAPQRRRLMSCGSKGGQNSKAASSPCGHPVLQPSGPIRKAGRVRRRRDVDSSLVERVEEVTRCAGDCRRSDVLRRSRPCEGQSWQLLRTRHFGPLALASVTGLLEHLFRPPFRLLSSLSLLRHLLAGAFGTSGYVNDALKQC